MDKKRGAGLEKTKLLNKWPQVETSENKSVKTLQNLGGTSGVAGVQASCFPLRATTKPTRVEGA